MEVTGQVSITLNYWQINLKDREKGIFSNDVETLHSPQPNPTT